MTKTINSKINRIMPKKNETLTYYEYLYERYRQHDNLSLEDLEYYEEKINE